MNTTITQGEMMGAWLALHKYPANEVSIQYQKFCDGYYAHAAKHAEEVALLTAVREREEKAKEMKDAFGFFIEVLGSMFERVGGNVPAELAFALMHAKNARDAYDSSRAADGKEGA